MLKKYYERFQSMPEEVDSTELRRLIEMAQNAGGDADLIEAARTLLEAAENAQKSDTSSTSESDSGGFTYDREAAIRELNEKMAEPMWTREERREREERETKDFDFVLTDEECQAIIALGDKLERVMMEMGIDLEGDDDKGKD